MSEHSTFEGNFPSPYELAERPDLKQLDDGAAALLEMSSKHYRLKGELDSYFWTDGNPLVRVDPIILTYGGNGSSLCERSRSEAYQVAVQIDPKSSMSLRDAERAIFGRDDIPLLVSRIDPVDDDESLFIGKVGDKVVLVGANGNVMSPLLSTIVPAPNMAGAFLVTNDSRSREKKPTEGTLLVLNETERTEVLAKKKELEELRTFLYEEDNTGDIVSRHKALLDEIMKSKGLKVDRLINTINSVELTTEIDGIQYHISVNGTLTTFNTYKADMGNKEYDQMHEEYYRLCQDSTNFRILDRYLDSGNSPMGSDLMDALLDDYDGYIAEKRQFIQRLKIFQEKYDYRTFTLSTEHALWAIPIGLKISQLPFSEALPFIDLLQLEGRNQKRGGLFTVTEPGKIVEGYPRLGIEHSNPDNSWRVNSQGKLELEAE